MSVVHGAAAASASAPAAVAVNDSNWGLTTIGNSGSGKSFLMNTLIGKDEFIHRFSPGSVTTVTEWREFITSEGVKWHVFNIPGLIESDHSNASRNKMELERAFDKCPVTIILFVLNAQGGRVGDDDITAFKACREAFDFKPESIGFIVNDLPSTIPNSQRWQGEFISRIHSLTELHEAPVIFVNRLVPVPTPQQLEAMPEDERPSPDELSRMTIRLTKGKDGIKQQIVQLVSQLKAKQHVKVKEIMLQADQLKQEKEKNKRLQDEFDKKLSDLSEKEKQTRAENEYLKAHPPQPTVIHHYHNNDGGGGCQIM